MYRANVLLNGGLLAFQEEVVAMGIASEWSTTMGRHEGSSGSEEYFLMGLRRIGVLVRDAAVLGLGGGRLGGWRGSSELVKV